MMSILPTIVAPAAPESRRCRPLQVLAFVPYWPDTAPSQRYRIEQWQPFLRADGIEIELAPFADEHLTALLKRPGRLAAKSAAMVRAFKRAAFRLRRISDFDAVVIHRTISMVGPALLERITAAIGKPIIYDFDDAIFLLDSSRANSRLSWLKWSGKTATICRMSARVIAGNEYLRDYASQFNSHVSVVPSGVDTNRYTPRPQRRDRSKKVIVGWSGSSTSQRYLVSCGALLAEIGRLGNIEIRVHSDERPHIDGVPVVWRPWSARTEIAELSRFDIGIMPMPDEAWTRGKCAMKCLLYMAMGVPTVASPVGMNREVVRDGENGFLAANTEEWMSAIEHLARDADLREFIGCEGRRTVEQAYSAEICAGRFGQVIRSLPGCNAHHATELGQW